MTPSACQACCASRHTSPMPLPARHPACSRWASACKPPCRFHEVEPHAAVKADTPSKTSRRVVSNALRTVPFPLLGENTLTLSDHMCLAPDENGHMSVMFRYAYTPPCALQCVVLLLAICQHGGDDFKPHGAPHSGTLVSRLCLKCAAILFVMIRPVSETLKRNVWLCPSMVPSL